MSRSEYEDAQRENDDLLRKDFKKDLDDSIAQAKGSIKAYFIQLETSTPEISLAHIDDVTEYVVKEKGIPVGQAHERFVYGRDVVKAAIRQLVAEGVLLQSGTILSRSSTPNGV